MTLIIKGFALISVEIEFSYLPLKIVVKFLLSGRHNLVIPKKDI